MEIDFQTFTLIHYIIFFLTGIIAGFFDSIAGGGGIITVPVLLSFGIPPHYALGTNKLQSSFGSFTAAFNYSRKGLISFSEIKTAILFTAIGACTGAITIQFLSAGFLNIIIPIFLCIIFFYTIFSPNLGEKTREPLINKNIFYIVAGLVLGFYDGFFGPGTGSFWVIGIVMLIGLNLKKATAFTKFTNFTSNFVALIFFIIGGKVLFLVGICMGTGQIIGAFAGSRLVILKDTSFVRVFFIFIVAATLIKLIYTSYIA
ncbi:MAG: TSUP family transporter [Desulfobacteraceae bacterium]|nr:TSUP family transporter [Desulfobacteraceae bacterium]